MCPESGKSSPATNRSGVVFPEPEGPSKATSSPSSTARETPSNAMIPPNRRTSCFTSMRILEGVQEFKGVPGVQNLKHSPLPLSLVSLFSLGFVDGVLGDHGVPARFL